MKNEELVTKEELLELGFEEKSKDYYCSSCSRWDIDLKRGKIEFNCLLGCEYNWLYEYKATKANVFKLIEIAKLIGELE